METMDQPTPVPARPDPKNGLFRVLLLGAIALALAGGSWVWLRAGADAVPAGSRRVSLEVGGMVCTACTLKIHEQLVRIPGVARVEVSLDRRSAQVICAATVADTALTAAVRRAGPDFVALILPQ